MDSKAVCLFTELHAEPKVFCPIARTSIPTNLGLLMKYLDNINLQPSIKCNLFHGLTMLDLWPRSYERILFQLELFMSFDCKYVAIISIIITLIRCYLNIYFIYV
jgi:hypothetical protein